MKEELRTIKVDNDIYDIPATQVFCNGCEYDTADEEVEGYPKSIKHHCSIFDCYLVEDILCGGGVYRDINCIQAEIPSKNDEISLSQDEIDLILKTEELVARKEIKYQIFNSEEEIATLKEDHEGDWSLDVPYSNGEQMIEILELCIKIIKEI